MGRAPVPGQRVVQPGPDVAVVVEAEHLCLGQLSGEHAAVPLGQAPRGHHLRAAPGGVEQLAHRLLLGRLDEPAGVHEDHARLIAAGEGPPRGLQPGGELLGVHLITGAAQGHEADRALRRLGIWLTR